MAFLIGESVKFLLLVFIVKSVFGQGDAILLYDLGPKNLKAYKNTKDEGMSAKRRFDFLENYIERISSKVFANSEMGKSQKEEFKKFIKEYEKEIKFLKLEIKKLKKVKELDINNNLNKENETSRIVILEKGFKEKNVEIEKLKKEVTDLRGSLEIVNNLIQSLHINETKN